MEQPALAHVQLDDVLDPWHGHVQEFLDFQGHGLAVADNPGDIGVVDVADGASYQV